VGQGDVDERLGAADDAVLVEDSGDVGGRGALGDLDLDLARAAPLVVGRRPEALLVLLVAEVADGADAADEDRGEGETAAARPPLAGSAAAPARAAGRAAAVPAVVPVVLVIAAGEEVTLALVGAGVPAG